MSHKYRYDATVTRIIDGDTFVAAFDLGFGVRIEMSCRMAGIDTPEIFGVPKDSEEYKAGMRAKDWLTEQVMGKTIFIESRKFEKYGRALVVAYHEEPINLNFDMSINRQMIDLGLARVSNG